MEIASGFASAVLAVLARFWYDPEEHTVVSGLQATLSSLQKTPQHGIVISLRLQLIKALSEQSTWGYACGNDTNCTM
eukprot:590881-Amphidinium_carterae.1